MQRLSGSILLTAVLGNLVFLSDARAISNSNLTVTVEGVKNPRGQVCLSVFSSSQGFPNNSAGALQAQCVKATQTPLQVTFQNLKPGSYAVAVFYDANGDGTLNSNFLGIPTEGFGFSRNPKIRTGPPKFADSAFQITGSNTNIQIQLQYFFEN